MLEQSQQMIPVKIGLYARRVVVDPQRQVHRVRHLEVERLDVGLSGANVGWGGDDRAVRAVRAVRSGELDVGDHLARVRAGASIEESHSAGAPSHRFHDELSFFNCRQQRGLTR
jgi:hypothetical protein